MSAPLAFRNQFLDDHEDHGTRGKGQSVGEECRRGAHQECSGDSGEWLDDPRQLAEEEAAPSGLSLAYEYHRDGQTFGQVLKPQSEAEGDGCAKGCLRYSRRSSTRCDTDGESFGNVVKGDGQDDEGATAATW